MFTFVFKNLLINKLWAVLFLVLLSKSLSAQWTTNTSGGECILYNCVGSFNSAGVFYSIGPFTSTYDASYGTVNPPTPGNSYINCSCTTNNPLIKKTFITYPQESVGIGIATPTEKLEVAGKIVTTNLQLTGGTPGVGKILSSDAIGNASWLTIPQVTNSWQRDAANVLYYDTKAYVGPKRPTSGTHANYKFAVDGKLVAKSIYVVPTNDPAWADDVFEPAYKLPTLADTEAYVQKHGHLPGIPTTAEIKEKGIDIGTMDAKILRKLEELYLHVIRLEKENIELKKMINK